MFLYLGIVLFVASCFLEVCGADWIQSEINADRRARMITGAISSSTSELKSCYQNLFQDQIDYYQRFREDMKNEREFCDEHGRWYRERNVYDSDGKIIAQEIVALER